jgi:hypothetical protein
LSFRTPRADGLSDCRHGLAFLPGLYRPISPSTAAVRPLPDIEAWRFATAQRHEVARFFEQLRPSQRMVSFANLLVVIHPTVPFSGSLRCFSGGTGAVCCSNDRISCVGRSARARLAAAARTTTKPRLAQVTRCLRPMKIAEAMVVRLFDRRLRGLRGRFQKQRAVAVALMRCNR